jgi:peroxiredoxin
VTTVALVCRLILAGCLAVAGGAKLADPRGSREAMAGFGGRESLTGVAAVGVAGVELAIAVALVPMATATAAAAAALALLVLFSAVLAVRLAQGEQPDCHCFGRLSAKPATWGALVRNAGLGATAALVLAYGPGPSAVGWVGDLSPAGQVALAAGVVLALVVTAFVLRPEDAERGQAPAPSNGYLASLPIGVRAPRFELPATDGDAVSLDGLLAGGRPVLLVFSDTGCGACEALLPRVGQWQRDRHDDLVVAVVSAGHREELRRKRADYDLDLVLRDPEPDGVASAYGAGQMPAAVLVDSRGRVASRVVAGEGDIAMLADELIGVGVKDDSLG